MTLDVKQNVKSTLDRITLQRRSNLIAEGEEGVMQPNNVGESYMNSVFVLTDGIPPIPPPVSYEAAMNAVLEDTKTCRRISFKKKVDTKNGKLEPNITVDGCLKTVLYKDELFIKLTPYAKCVCDG